MLLLTSVTAFTPPGGVPMASIGRRMHIAMKQPLPTAQALLAGSLAAALLQVPVGDFSAAFAEGKQAGGQAVVEAAAPVPASAPPRTEKARLESETAKVAERKAAEDARIAELKRKSAALAAEKQAKAGAKATDAAARPSSTSKVTPVAAPAPSAPKPAAKAAKQPTATPAASTPKPAAVAREAA